MKIKNYINFLNEVADELNTPAPPSQTPPAQPAPQAQPAAQPAPQSQSGTTETPAQPAPQAQGEQKSGDLSNYNNEAVTKNPDTVKKIVDMIKDLDKSQLIKLRDFIGELKDIEDPKNEIGKI